MAYVFYDTGERNVCSALASKSKFLADSNKSRTASEATKKRSLGKLLGALAHAATAWPRNGRRYGIRIRANRPATLLIGAQSRRSPPKLARKRGHDIESAPGI